ncbi:hypothetical protein [Streptomyces sp. NPDC018833]|uniref:hypothetical protein n=1 Tax=Streptomyces sp. NPDC018833 TaxID=3365053 RepID=UPI0037990A9E
MPRVRPRPALLPRAEEIFEENTRLPANPLASPEDIEELDGWTLHRLHHSALTHDAEGDTSTPMLLARSRPRLRPLPPRLRPLPGAVRPPRRRRGRPARRRA